MEVAETRCDSHPEWLSASWIDSDVVDSNCLHTVYRRSVPDSNRAWLNVGPTSVLFYQRQANLHGYDLPIRVAIHRPVWCTTMM